MLEINKKLFERLHSEKIVYCHWKSNFRLNEALEGKTDLDILVKKEHILRFEQVLSELGFKQLKPPSWDDYPFVVHYLGYDEKTSSFSHLHIYYGLIMGKKLMKEYCLPIEENIFDNLIIKNNVFVPIRELELIISLFRIMAKYRNIYNLSILDKKEFYLMKRECNLSKMEGFLRKIGEVTDIPLVILKETIFHYDKVPSNHIRKLKKAFSKFRRFSKFEYIFVYLVRKTFSKLMSKKKSLVCGGDILTFIGIDGAGKTTVIKELIKRLGEHLDVKYYYLGASKNSLEVQIVNLILRVIKKINKFLNLNFFYFLEDFFKLICEYFYVKRRYKYYRKGVRDFYNGRIVIFERFPINKTVDHYTSDLKYRNLKWIEKRIIELYRKISFVGKIFFLDIPFEESLLRKKVSDTSFLKKKYINLQRFYQENKEKIINIDATKTVEEVVKDILDFFWYGKSS